MAFLARLHNHLSSEKVTFFLTFPEVDLVSSLAPRHHFGCSSKVWVACVDKLIPMPTLRRVPGGHRVYRKVLLVDVPSIVEISYPNLFRWFVPVSVAAIEPVASVVAPSTFVSFGIWPIDIPSPVLLVPLVPQSIIMLPLLLAARAHLGAILLVHAHLARELIVGVGVVLLLLPQLGLRS